MSVLTSYIAELAPTNWFKLDEASGTFANSGTQLTVGTAVGTVARGVAALDYAPEGTEKAVNLGGGWVYSRAPQWRDGV